MPIEKGEESDTKPINAIKSKYSPVNRNKQSMTPELAKSIDSEEAEEEDEDEYLRNMDLPAPKTLQIARSESYQDDEFLRNLVLPESKTTLLEQKNFKLQRTWTEENLVLPDPKRAKLVDDHFHPEIKFLRNAILTEIDPDPIRILFSTEPAIAQINRSDPQIEEKLTNQSTEVESDSNSIQTSDYVSLDNTVVQENIQHTSRI